MPLKPHFLHTDISELRISRQRLIGGVIIGLLYAFALYGLLYMSREVMRIMSVTRNYDLVVMSGAEVNFYNLVFAFIAVIFGFSTGFLFCVERPRKAFGQLRHQRFSILNDLRVLNWSFLGTYTKLAFSIGLILSSSFGYYNFFPDDSLFPSYNYVYILIIIVLFLQMWTTMRQVFRNKSIKWMLVSMLGLVIAGFGLSKINLIDYKAVNASILKHNVSYTYNIELPDLTNCKHNIFERLYSRGNDVYIVQNPSETDSTLLVFFERKQTSLKGIKDEMRAYYRESELGLIRLNLHIHREIKMKQLQKIYGEIGEEGFMKFYFAINKIYHKDDEKYYHDYSLPALIPVQHLDSLLRPLMEDSYKFFLKKMDDVIEVRYSESGYLVDSVLLEREAFKRTVGKRICESSPKYMIKFHINDDMNVESYVQTLALIKETYQETTDEYVMQKYGKTWEWLPLEQKRETRMKYPYAVFQITEEMESNYE